MSDAHCSTVLQILKCWLDEWRLRWFILDLVRDCALLRYHCRLLGRDGVHVSVFREFDNCPSLPTLFELLSLVQSSPRGIV